MKLRIPLYGKLLLWLGMNLVLIAVLFIALPGRTGSGWNLLLSPSVREHLLLIGANLGRELSLVESSRWNEVLARYDETYGVSFSANLDPGGPGGPPDGPHGFPGAPGESPPPPPPGEANEEGFSDQPFGAPGPPPNRMDGGRQLRTMPGPDRKRLADLVSASHPRSFGPYLVWIPSSLNRSGLPPQPLDITAAAPALTSFLGFLGITDWVVFASLVILLSAALWWPFMWGITRTIVQVTRATHRIAEGRFDVRVDAHRRDELGQLAESINRMAERLDSQLAAQKQFIADVAHEVTSPLARLQIGLGILESGDGKVSSQAVADLHDDAAQMAEMLNELLLFSRAGAESARIEPELIELRSIAVDAAEREDAHDRVIVDIAADLKVMAHRPMLLRALSNLVRNALRYADDPATPIEITAMATGTAAHILVRDRGPGVPEQALSRLGDPFYRAETSRSRDSGGFGLGLAIVRRCIAACGGEVSFRNRSGGGFEADIRLDTAP